MSLLQSGHKLITFKEYSRILIHSQSYFKDEQLLSQAFRVSHITIIAQFFCMLFIVHLFFSFLTLTVME